MHLGVCPTKKTHHILRTASEPQGFHARHEIGPAVCHVAIGLGRIVAEPSSSRDLGRAYSCIEGGLGVVPRWVQ